VMTKMRVKASKKTVGEFYLRVGDDILSVGFVPLCAPKRPLTVRCPLCGIVMKTMHTKKNGTIYFCPECGIHG
jgi:predicted RNA-binding Zn-ribbon protein involved in translation (DUF1610 family)